MMEEKSKFGLKSSRDSREIFTPALHVHTGCEKNVFIFTLPVARTLLCLTSSLARFRLMAFDPGERELFFRARPAVTREFCGLISSTASCNAPVQKQAELDPFQIKSPFQPVWIDLPVVEF